MARYEMTYINPNGNSAWSEETNSLQKAQKFARHYETMTSAVISVWDRKTHTYLYMKRVLESTPEIDRF